MQLELLHEFEEVEDERHGLDDVLVGLVVPVLYKNRIGEKAEWF